MITSKDNPQVKAAVRLRENARARREQGLFFLEGFRLCADAIASGYLPQTLFITEAARQKYGVPESPSLPEESCLLIADAVAQKLGDTSTPQGIFGIFQTVQSQPDFWQPGGKYIALEQVQDPGNLGAIARTAEALGLDGMLVSGGCDVHHPKALRASMGSLLRLPVMETDDLAETLASEALASYALPCYAAAPDNSAMPVGGCDFSKGAVIVIGNEGNGLSEEAIAACNTSSGGSTTIPMRGKAESLNAAAAATILMWEMMRQ